MFRRSSFHVTFVIKADCSAVRTSQSRRTKRSDRLSHITHGESNDYEEEKSECYIVFRNCHHQNNVITVTEKKEVTVRKRRPLWCSSYEKAWGSSSLQQSVSAERQCCCGCPVLVLIVISIAGLLLTARKVTRGDEGTALVTISVYIVLCSSHEI